MSQPISVVIAAKNSADTLGDQLAALVSQHWPAGGEIIVADNGSTDTTADVAASFNSEQRRVIVLPCAEVAGAAYARNRGVEIAMFDRLGFCDADDVVGDEWIEELGRALDSADAVGGYLDLDRLNTEAAAQSRGNWNRHGLPLLNNAVPVLSSCNLGMTRSLFEEVGGFDPNFPRSQDAELSIRIHRSGAPTVYAERAVVHYRMRTTVREVFLQAYRWGINEPTLLADIDPNSNDLAPRRIARSWAWLVKSLPLLTHETGRLRYAYVLGKRVGFLEGVVDLLRSGQHPWSLLRSGR